MPCERASTSSIQKSLNRSRKSVHITFMCIHAFSQLNLGH
jgi:hypothetical protein